MRIESSWADIDTTFPGLKGLWKQLRKELEIRTRAPKSVTVTDNPCSPTPWNDSYVGRCYPLDLSTMVVGSPRTTGYDVALYVPDGMTKQCNDIPPGAALLFLEWNDYYRHVVMTIQVSALPKHLA